MPTWVEIENRVYEIITGLLGATQDDITLKTNLVEDLGTDDLDQVELIMALEEAFSIELLDEDVNVDIGAGFSTENSKFKRIEDILFCLTTKLGVKLGPNEIDSKTLAFRVRQDGHIEVGLQKTDGSWVYADGKTLLPSGIYFTVFTKWADILKELEDLINAPDVFERDLQKFLEKYPDLLKGDEYDLVIPEARIIREDQTFSKGPWRADFVLSPIDQNGFCKILELKLPKADLARNPKRGHPKFYTDLFTAINQLRDYGEAFNDTPTREKFRQMYRVSVYKPDLQLVVGRKWDMLHMKNMLELQRRNNLKIESWDSLLEKFRRKFAY